VYSEKVPLGLRSRCPCRGAACRALSLTASSPHPTPPELGAGGPLLIRLPQNWGPGGLSSSDSPRIGGRRASPLLIRLPQNWGPGGLSSSDSPRIGGRGAIFKPPSPPPSTPNAKHKKTSFFTRFLTFFPSWHNSCTKNSTGDAPHSPKTIGSSSQRTVQLAFVIKASLRDKSWPS
jgi:hypothetical protein